MTQPNATPLLERPDTDVDVEATFRELTGYEEQPDDGSDKDRFAHYANKDDIVRAATEGVAIVALCGKKWKPQRSPQKYPVCPTCREIYESLDPGDDEN